MAIIGTILKHILTLGLPVLWRWLRQSNLVSELEEKCAELGDQVVSLKGALAHEQADRRTAEAQYNDAMDHCTRLADRVAELESASRTDHATIGDLHQQLSSTKRQLSAAKANVTKLRKQLGLPVKRGAK